MVSLMSRNELERKMHVRERPMLMRQRKHLMDVVGNETDFCGVEVKRIWTGVCYAVDVVEKYQVE